MNIPVRNIYYILCYAFSYLEEGRSIEVGQENFDNTANLFAKFLTSSCDHLRKKGLWRSYKESEQELNCVRGRIQFKESLLNNRLAHGKVVCLSDDLTLDALPNQIIKATLQVILKSGEVDKIYESDLHRHLKYLENVSDIKLQKLHFNSLVFNRNNQFYRFLMHLCELAFDCWLPDSKLKGKYLIKDLLQDEVRMRSIFENFIKNFFSQNKSGFDKVASETMRWDAVPLSEDGYEFLPIMRTDISLTGKNRTLIIDTKYSAQALVVNQYGKAKIDSSYLYQLTTYLDHKQIGLSHKPEGMLLYPANGKSLRLKYEIKGKILSVCTVDLNQRWEDVEAELLGLVG